MPYQVSRYKKQSPFTKAMYGLLTQGLPAYASYRMEQKAEREKKKEADRKIKEAKMKNELDFYTAMTKDRNPMVAGMAVGKIEELLGKTPYSVVAGQEKLRPRGMPQRATLQPGRMPMGPRLGGMTTRQPSMSEIVSGAEPERKKWEPATEEEYKRSKEYGAKPQLGKTPAEREKERQYERDMNLINNYYSKEGDEFTMPYDVAKMIEAQVKEASMRQFGKFLPRLPEEKRPTIFRKDLPQRLGTMQIRKTKEEWDKIYRNK